MRSTPKCRSSPARRPARPGFGALLLLCAAAGGPGWRAFVGLPSPGRAPERTTRRRAEQQQQQQRDAEAVGPAPSRRDLGLGLLGGLGGLAAAGPPGAALADAAPDVLIDRLPRKEQDTKIFGFDLQNLPFAPKKEEFEARKKKDPSFQKMEARGEEYPPDPSDDPTIRKLQEEQWKETPARWERTYLSDVVRDNLGMTIFKRFIVRRFSDPYKYDLLEGDIAKIWKSEGRFLKESQNRPTELAIYRYASQADEDTIRTYGLNEDKSGYTKEAGLKSTLRMPEELREKLARMRSRKFGVDIMPSLTDTLKAQGGNAGFKVIEQGAKR